MSETQQHSSVEFTSDIRIVGLNREKTRLANGSDIIYNVHFELSGTPPIVWRNIFEGEWKVLNPAQPHLWQATGIERGFLVIHCPLQEIAAQLPVLKKAIAATNKTYEQYAQEQATEQKHREDVWKRERKAVDDIAETLKFE
jgi:hypothetical protein